MNATGIFYGSSGGNTESVAKRIAQKLGVSDSDIYDVGSAKASDLTAYNRLIFGSSTWGLGDLQDDWEGFIREIDRADLTGKKIALFGCGDSSSYPDTFCDAVGKIYQVVKDRATVIGFTDTAGYSFDASEAVVNNCFVGLVIDEDNESHLTETRIDRWVVQLKNEPA
ncbi:MAG: flavodoxin [Dysgonamonadaceae bacterium]|jgi:flavodoxin I|nr:flavodoxin [Dysgonamonadaceae bacterium]